MNPFKEPQPRKKSIQEEHEAKQKGVFPPYARLGNEARWSTEPQPPLVTAEEQLAEYRQTPIMVVPDHSPFELRKAALEAACVIQSGHLTNTSEIFWNNVETFENYLRDGTKP